MAKDQSGFGKIIETLFHRKHRSEPEEVAVNAEEAQQPEVAQAPVSEAEPLQPDQISVEEGALLQVWNRWSKGEQPPVLSMCRGETPLPIEDHLLKHERDRLARVLECDAKLYMSRLEVQYGQPEPIIAPFCKVYISENRMVAWAFLFPPANTEEKFPFEQIGKVMQERGISSGIDSTAIVYLFQEQAYFQLIPIAYGTPAIQGEDGQVIERYPREIQREIKVDEKGVADYRASNYVQLIQKGDVICDIVDPKEGTPGICVDGKVIEPKAVHIDKIPKGRNTVMSEDGHQLLAGLDGHLQYSNQAFQVRPVLEIGGDVDYTTGNIDFNGDVHIGGDIRENFSVRATGTITVDGLVEAATIEAGGDLVVASGVLGNYKAVLKSWGCVRVKYLENCVVYASKGVYADYIMSSQIFSDDCIQVTSGRGAAIGGTLTAAYTIRANLIGSQAGRKTQLKLGTMAFAEEDLRSNRAELDEVRKELQELDGELKVLVEQKGMADGSTKLSKAQLRKSVLALKEMQLLKHREKLEPETPDLSKCRVSAGVIYPITQVTMGVDCLNIETITSNCTIKYDVQQGEIQLT